MVGTLELDGLESMTIIEAGSDQEQCIEIGTTLEGMMCNEVLQILVLLGLKMLRQGAQIAFDTDFVACWQRVSQRLARSTIPSSTSSH